MTDDALLIESIERKKLTDERKRTQYARAYVKKGAQHLDLHMPDWASRINVDIDPQTECARIIEQLYDKYQDGHDALVANRSEIRDIFEKSGKVLAVFNGHVHWNRMDIHNGIPYFNITSIVENFKNDDTPSESFAVVDLHHESITVDIRGNDSAHFQHSF